MERRIRQIAVSVDANRNLQIGLTLNSILYEEDVKLRRRVDSYSGQGGSYGSTPNTDDDFTVPNAPAGLSVSSSTFISNQGVYTGAFSGTWTAPTTNVDGSGLTDLEYYEMQYRYVGDTNWQFVVRTSGTETTLGYSPVTPGRQIEVRVRAVDDSAHVSAWAAPTVTHTVASDVTAPPIPSKPTVVSGIETVKVVWDGLSSTAGSMGNDFDRTEIWVSNTNNFTPGAGGSTKIGDFFVLGGSLVVHAPLIGQPYYFRLVAVDKAGNKSAASTIENNVSTAVSSSDDTAPASAPTVQLIGGLNVVQARWDGITNNDPVTYDVYASTTPSPVTTDPDFLAESTDATAITLRTIWDVTAGARVPLTAQTTAYVVVVPRDEDGLGPPAAEVSATPVQITSPDIAANQGWFGFMSVDKLTSGTLSADVLLGASFKTALAGARTEIGPSGGLWFDSNGDPVITLPNDISLDNPAQFKGAVEAQSLDVLGGATFRGSSEMTPGSSLMIGNSLQPPTSSPLVSVGLETLTLTGFDFTSLPILGLWWDATNSQWQVYTAIPLPPTGNLILKRVVFSSAGAWVSTTTINSPLTILPSDTLGGVAKVGANWYWTHREAATGITRIVNSLGSWIDIAQNNASSPPAIGYDGTDLYLAEPMGSSGPRVWRYATAAAAGANLITNPSFETVTSPWTAQMCTLTRVSGIAGSVGTWVGALTKNSTPITSMWIELPEANYMTVVPGKKYTFSAKFRAATTGRWCQVRAGFEDAAGNPTGSIIYSNTANDTTSGWVTCTGTFTAPIGAVKVSMLPVVLWSSNIPQNEVHYVDDVQLTSTSGTNLIEQITNLAAPPDGTGAQSGLSGVWRGSADFGADSIVVGTPKSQTGKSIVPYDPATGVVRSTSYFPTEQSTAAQAFHWDGSFFWEMGADFRLYKHTAITWTTESPTWWAGYGWMDTAAPDTHETPIGKLGSLTMRKRARVSLTTAEVPTGGLDDPNGATFYIGRLPVFTITNKALTSNVATLTTSAAHGYVTGDKVVVTGVAAPFSGTWVLTGAPTSTTFTFTKVNANITSAATSGSVVKSQPSRTEMFYQTQATPVPPSAIAAATLTTVNFTGNTNPITGLLVPPNPASNPKAFLQSSPATIYSQALRIDTLPKMLIDGDGNGRFDGLLPPGSLILSAVATAPAGWLLCDGSAISRVLYPDLFAAIGITFGAGDTTTTFNIPDFRGRFPIGTNPDAVTYAKTLGYNDGSSTATREDRLVHIHRHSIPAQGDAPVTGAAGTVRAILPQGHAHGGDTGNTGLNDGGSLNIHALLTINYLIKF